MKVNFSIFPKDYQFFSRNDSGYADIRFKGEIQNDTDVGHTIVVRAVSMTTGMITAKFIENQIEKNEEFDFKLSVPSGSNYRIDFTVSRKNNEEWIAYVKSFYHISVGDVFVIAGQSNAVGYGRGRYKNSFNTGIHNFKLSGEWALASHPLNDLTGYDGKIERDSGEYSPHITMAEKIIEHTAVPVAFVPCAVGGTSISRWNKRINGDLYYDMIERIKKANIKISGMIFSQGCTDAMDSNDKMSKNYYTYLKEFISDTRKDLNIPELKIFIYQLNRVGVSPSENDERFSLVREAQARLSREDKNVFCVSTFGAELMADKIHNSPQGCDLMGERMAGTILKELYNIPVLSNVPIAEYFSYTSKKITIYFNQETYFVSDNVNNKKYDFKVVDKNGEVKIKEIYLKKNVAILCLEREPVKRFCVYGGYGSSPLYDIPYDIISKIPMLSFKIDSEEEIV